MPAEMQFSTLLKDDLFLDVFTLQREALEFFFHPVELHFFLEQPNRLFDVPSYLNLDHDFSSMQITTLCFRNFQSTPVSEQIEMAQNF